MPGHGKGAGKQLIGPSDRNRWRHKAVWAFATVLACTHILFGQRAVPPAILAGRKALEAKDYQHAEEIFSAYVKDHPGNIDGEEGVGDAELGLQEYEAAELQYRAVVAVQPEFWLAHKNLVIVEAALRRWGEFDRERALLRGARERCTWHQRPRE